MNDHYPNNKEITADNPALELEPERYMKHMDDFELSEEEKVEFLKTLFNIMKTFVDIGWGLDSVQLLSPEIMDGKDGNAYPDSVNMLDDKDTQNNFSLAAKDTTNKEDADAPKHTK